MFAPIYLDHNATTPVEPEVLEAMLPFLGARHGNPSSRHEYGRHARAALDQARAQVAAAVGAHATEVVFTSGGSEANNLFLKGAAACRKPGLVVTSPIEHPCVREPVRQLQALGWAHQQLGVDQDGRLLADAAERLQELRPGLVSVMIANNESGVLQDIAPLAAAVRRTGGWMHSDAVQALGKIPLDFRALGVHAMSLSSHKIGGPLGAGALVLDKRVELQPLIAGGGQERGLRSGTENVPAIVGFGKACELLLARHEDEAARLEALRNRCQAGLGALGVTVFSAGAPRLPNTLFVGVDGIEGDTLVGKLDRAGFACASGSACSSADPHPSRTLLAMGVPEGLARGAVRISLGRHSTGAEVDAFLRAFAGLLAELKSLTAVAVQ